MATIYVGPSSAGSADGTSWANRYGTLNAAEDRPVAAGDVVYVGPGVYRGAAAAILTCDVSGSSGNPITYIADVTGQNTDGIGGPVRLTQSTDDVSGIAYNIISAGSRSYRTFRGFHFICGGANAVALTTCQYWVFEDCAFELDSSGFHAILCTMTTTPTYLTVRRCVFSNLSATGVVFTATSNTADTATITNCIFHGSKYNAATGISLAYVSGVTIAHCLFDGNYYAVRLVNNPSSGSNVVNNSVFFGGRYALNAPTGGYLTENYNVIYSSVVTPRTNVSTGANSVTQFVNLELPLLYQGALLGDWNPYRPTRWSDHKRKVGTGMASEDLFGFTRPSTDSKKSWGPIQYQEPIRSTTQTYESSAASLLLEDAGEVQVVIPVTATSTTITCRVYREADYAGTAPQMVIRQAGQSDRTVTDGGSAGAWNTLTDTFTPAALPSYVTLLLRSLNTATSGSYATYFDSLTVS